MFKSYGISNYIFGWMVSKVPKDRIAFIFKGQVIHEKSLCMELRNLTLYIICLLSHTVAIAPNFSRFTVHFNWFTLTPLPQRNRQQLHRCWVSLCDENPVMLAGKIWYVLAKQPHKFWRTHWAFVSLLFTLYCWNPVIKSLIIRRRTNVIALAEHTPISASKGTK